MNPVRISVVGMGIGRFNGRALNNNPRGQVVALCDLIQDRMDDFATELPDPVKTYVDYREMCKDPDIDAVMVATPNQVHVEVALEAVKNDKHVLVTKPLSESLPTAEKLVEVAEASGVVNMMSLNTRFGPNVQYLGQLAREGFFGDIYYGHAISIRRSGIPDWNLGFVQEGGGAFRDMGVHVLDSSWWIMGKPEPVSVSGCAGAKFGPVGKGYWDFHQPDEEYWSQFGADDYGGGFIRFADGSGLLVESLWASHMPTKFQIELFGTEAGGTSFPLNLYRTVNGAPQDTTVEIPKDSPTGWDNLAGHFIDCIADGIPCEAPLRHGMIVQKMMEGLLESGRTGEEIRLDK